MFKALIGSLMGKLATVGLLLVGLAGGMAAVNALPFLGGVEPTASVSSGTPAPNDVALDFPSSVLDKVAPVPVVPEPVQAIEVVAAAAPAPLPVARVKPAAPVQPECVGQIQSLVSGLVGTVQGLVTAEQAQAALAQAGTIAEATQVCVTQTAAVNGLGLDQLNQLSTQLVGSVTQIQERFPSAPSPVTNPVGGLLGLVGKGLNLGLSGVSKGTELLGTGLGSVLTPGS